MKVVFIVGSGHSGSTLLDLLLDGHPEIVGVGEMFAAAHDEQCTCGRIALKCPLWQHALGPGPWPNRVLYRTRWDALWAVSRYRSAQTKEVIDHHAYVAKTVAAYERIAEFAQATIVVDSSKSIDRAELVASSAEIEPIIIHLVRDGRAVTWSYERKYHAFFPFVLKWGLDNLKIELIKRRHRGVYIRVRYADLVDDSERVLRDICAKLGISYDPGMLNFRVGEHHQIGGNRMRLGTDATITRDDARKRDMPLMQRAIFDVVFGWLNRWYRSA